MFRARLTTFRYYSKIFIMQPINPNVLAKVKIHFMYKTREFENDLVT